jgi:3-oxoacyl-[acyl-carrier protein] reductase
MSSERKVTLITGGGRGIGAATARLLAARGTNVVVNYIHNRTTAEQVVSDIRAEGGQAIAVQADVRDPAACALLVQKTLTAFGRIDSLTHCAAIQQAAFKPFAAFTIEEFTRSVMGELTVVFEITKAVVPFMQQQHSGHLVYLGAGLVRSPQPSFIGVGVAKAGISTFAKYIAMEYGPDGITANVVEPGLVQTDLSTSYVSEQERQAMATVIPLGWIAQPDDVAGAIAFLAGDDSRYITGQTLPVNGGITMS